MAGRPTSCTKKPVVCLINVVVVNKFNSLIINRIRIRSVLIQERTGTAQSHACISMPSASSLKNMSEITISYYFPLTFSHSFILSLYLCDRLTLSHFINCGLQVRMKFAGQEHVQPGTLYLHRQHREFTLPVKNLRKPNISFFFFVKSFIMVGQFMYLDHWT